MSEFEQIKQHLKEKTGSSGKIFYYLPKLTDFQKQEIDFHNKIHHDEIEVHQLQSVRNSYYHNYFKKWLTSLDKNSVILEIGSGSGFDGLEIAKAGYQIIESDISLESIKGIQTKFKAAGVEDRTVFLVCDGQNLPFKNESLDAVFMVASLHHFEDQTDLLSEIKRVLKPNGLAIFAMEPSKFMMGFTKLFKHSQNLRIHDGHSEADETHDGYTKKQLVKLAKSNHFGVITIKRIWLTLGFFHYLLEGIFRLFKLKKRLQLPRFIEWFLLVIDELLLQIPFINEFNWHWIVILKKK